MKIRRITFWALGIFIGFGIFIAFIQKSADDVEAIEESKKGEIEVSLDSNKEEKYEKTFDVIMSEYQFQQAIHEMTHQKVYAQEKWGALEITEERIDELLSILAGSDFVHRELYFDILSEWKKGNFDNSVEAHNAIWEIQGGTIGKATRLLTEKEEEKYIKKHFK